MMDEYYPCLRRYFYRRGYAEYAATESGQNVVSSFNVLSPQSSCMEKYLNGKGFEEALDVGQNHQRYPAETQMVAAIVSNDAAHCNPVSAALNNHEIAVPAG